jgi:hypothetical protein
MPPCLPPPKEEGKEENFCESEINASSGAFPETEF